MAVTNAQRRYVRELHHGKGRRKYSAYLAEGLVNVREALTSGAPVREVYALPDVLVSMSEQLGGARVFEVGRSELGRLSTQRSPHGAVAVVEMTDYSLAEVLGAERLLHLDGLADPGNVGTLLRTAEWFGCGGVTAGPDTVDWYNPKVVAASRGSLFRLAHASLSSDDIARVFAARSVVVADLSGTEVGSFEWPPRAILSIGSESHGPSTAVLGLSPKRVTIAPAATSRADSLNAAVAGGILLAAWSRSLSQVGPLSGRLGDPPR